MLELCRYVEHPCEGVELARTECVLRCGLAPPIGACALALPLLGCVRVRDIRSLVVVCVKIAASGLTAVMKVVIASVSFVRVIASP